MGAYLFSSSASRSSISMIAPAYIAHAIPRMIPPTMTIPPFYVSLTPVRAPGVLFLLLGCLYSNPVLAWSKTINIKLYD